MTTKQISTFYRNLEPDINDNTISWRVYELVKSGVLSRVGRGKFILGEGRTFVPELSDKVKKLYRELNHEFPYIQTCIWKTSVLNEFMIHQPARQYILVEVDKDALESVFHFLSEKNESIFLDPTQKVLSLYASKESSPVVVKPLITEAPVQLVQGVLTATIEKILVDVFCDDVLFAAQQGSEMSVIFRNALENYIINENKVLRYADRRNRKEEFMNYLDKINFRQIAQNVAINRI